MTVQHWVQIYQSEMTKLVSRTAAKLGWGLSLTIGLSMPFIVYGLKWAALLLAAKFAVANGIEEEVPWDAISMDTALVGALWIRNFFLIAAFIILLSGVSFAGEFRDKTIREDLLRPVTRSGYLLAKWASLVTWTWVAVALTWLPCVLGSFLIFRGEGDMLAVTLGFGASAIADVALVSLVLAISVVTRSVPFTLMGVFLFYVLDYSLGLVLNWFPTSLLPKPLRWVGDYMEMISPWTFSSAIEVWKGSGAGTDWSWEGFATLFIVTAVSMLVSLFFFRRMDVP